MKTKIIAATLFATLNLWGVTIGTKPQEVTLSGKNGGMAKDNAPWSSKTLKNKVYVMFYVDPDEKDLNEAFSDALKAKEYRKKGAYGSIAIVNLAATWKPNVIIESLLKSKQKEFPQTVYVKDKKSILVKKWKLADDNNDILIFDKDGRVLFYKAGKMSKEDMQKAFKIIEEHL
jgi:predicted transcriptional regulator